MSGNIKANCHCGAFKYSFTLPEPLYEYKVCHCNCSICEKNGYLLVYPKRKDLVFEKGNWDELGEYKMATMAKTHKFCKNCASTVGIDFKMIERGVADSPEKDIIALNARMIQDIDIDKLNCSKFDGKNKLQPPYVVPE